MAKPPLRRHQIVSERSSVSEKIPATGSNFAGSCRPLQTAFADHGLSSQDCMNGPNRELPLENEDGYALPEAIR